MNLITNASDAVGDAAGHIRVKTGQVRLDREDLSDGFPAERLPAGDYVYLEVSDTGSGVDEETLPKIFDPFFSTKLTGRGLGLAAVLGIIRGHRGAVKVQSQPGKGTTFRSLFPTSSRAATSVADSPAHVEPWRGSGTVLVIDDEETVRSVAGRMLK